MVFRFSLYGFLKLDSQVIHRDILLDLVFPAESTYGIPMTFEVFMDIPLDLKKRCETYGHTCHRATRMV